MKKTKITLAIIGIVALLMVIAEGVRGLVANIKTDELVYIDYTEFVKDPTQYKNYMVRVDSVHIVNNPSLEMKDGDARILPVIIGETDIKEAYKFFIKFDANNPDVNLNLNPGQTVTGVLKSYSKVKGSDVAQNPLLIDTYSSPRAWYWNILLLLVPQIFIYLLANFIYLLNKNKAPKL